MEVVERLGPDAWLAQQLHPEQISDRVADSVLSLLETQRKQPFELIADHPTPEELNQRIALRKATADAAMKAGAMSGTADELPMMPAAAVPDSVEPQATRRCRRSSSRRKFPPPRCCAPC